MEHAVRWNIKVSKEIDLTLRSYLGAQGLKKADLSKFVEGAVRWRIFNRTVQDIKSRDADADTPKGPADWALDGTAPAEFAENACGHRVQAERDFDGGASATADSAVR